MMKKRTGFNKSAFFLVHFCRLIEIYQSVWNPHQHIWHTTEICSYLSLAMT